MIETLPTLPFSGRRAASSLLKRLRGKRQTPAPQPAPTSSAVAALTQPLLLPTGVRVAAAPVVGVEDDGRPRVRVPWTGLEAVADWAIPYRYLPVEGDVLTLIGQAERLYVLGVVQGQGSSHLLFEGDARLAAGGRLRLQADRVVRLVGETATLRAERIELAAGALHEKATDVFRVVRGLSRLVAGRVERVTEGLEYLAARKVQIAGREMSKVNAAEVIAIGS